MTCIARCGILLAKHQELWTVRAKEQGLVACRLERQGLNGCTCLRLCCLASLQIPSKEGARAGTSPSWSTQLHLTGFLFALMFAADLGSRLAVRVLRLLACMPVLCCSVPASQALGKYWQIQVLVAVANGVATCRGCGLPLRAHEHETS
eukprot:1160899-Pelagomonas_calceolata.AAC.2